MVDPVELGTPPVGWGRRIHPLFEGARRYDPTNPACALILTFTTLTVP